MNARTDAPATDAILGVRDVTFSYGDRNVLDGVSLSVRRGEVFGLLGPNGSGKSTLLSLLTGMKTLQGGQVLLDGAASSPHARVYRRSIGVVFQSPSLDAKLTARENLSLVATMHGFRGTDAAGRVDRALELARLTDRAASIVGELSGGMRRRLDIARALLPEPRILLMDEPTTGLDEASFRALWTHLEDANRRHGVTIIVSTHRPDEASRCDRLCVLHQGALAAVDTPAALCAHLSRDRVVLGTDAPDKVAERLRSDLGLDATASAGEVHIGCEDGHALVPRLFETLEAGMVRSAEVRRPGLADAYLALTGASLDAPEEAA